jgi:hypothetical protein
VAGLTNLIERDRVTPRNQCGFASAGEGSKRPTVPAATVYVVLDLDNPRIGFIRLDATDKILHDLHDSIRQ